MHQTEGKPSLRLSKRQQSGSKAYDIACIELWRACVVAPPRKRSTSAPSRKESTSANAGKQGSTVTAKSGGPAPKVQEADEDGAICPECNIQVGEESNAIECEVCNKWFRTACQSISNALYTVLAGEETANVSWFCNYCNHGSKHMLTKILKLNERQEKVEHGL